MKPFLTSEAPITAVNERRPSVHLSCSSDEHSVVADRTISRHAKSLRTTRCAGDLKDLNWIAKNKYRARKALESIIQSCHSCSSTRTQPTHDHQRGAKPQGVLPNSPSDGTSHTLALARSRQANAQPEKDRSRTKSHKRTSIKASLSSQRYRALHTELIEHGLNVRPAYNAPESLEHVAVTNARGLQCNAGDMDSNSVVHRLEEHVALEASNGQSKQVHGGSGSQKSWLGKAEDGISNKPQEQQTKDSPENGGVSDNQTKPGQKRRLASTKWEEDDFDDSGKDGDKHNSRKRPRNEESGNKRFACPFYKHNPQEYKSSRTCIGPGWSEIHRVKEHLLRRHRLSDYTCARCFEDFKTESELQGHQRQPIPCPVQDRPPGKEGINKEQEARLKSRKKSSGSKTEVERWYEMYKILFPDEENVPNPYYEPESGKSYSEPKVLSEYRSFLMRELPRLIREQFQELVDKRFEELHQDLTPLRQQIEAAVTTALQRAPPGPRFNESLAQELHTSPPDDQYVTPEPFPLDWDSLTNFDFDFPIVNDPLLLGSALELEPSSTWSADSAYGSIGPTYAPENGHQDSEATGIRKIPDER
ncbi:Fc.00g011300.m01.CDS01 [Cosmosporella sp. VM-42]